MFVKGLLSLYIWDGHPDALFRCGYLGQCWSILDQSDDILGGCFVNTCDWSKAPAWRVLSFWFASLSYSWQAVEVGIWFSLKWRCWHDSEFSRYLINFDASIFSKFLTKWSFCVFVAFVFFAPLPRLWFRHVSQVTMFTPPKFWRRWIHFDICWGVFYRCVLGKITINPRNLRPDPPNRPLTRVYLVAPANQ